MLSRVIILLSIALMNPAYGESNKCESQQSILVKDKKVTICYFEDEKTWMDDSCLKNKNCGARDFLKPHASDKEKSMDSIVKNPCSDLCHNRGGEIQLGTNERGSSTSFCIAKDRSMIDCARLTSIKE